jgi:outer membrane receptor protein involved in Fe transport
VTAQLPCGFNVYVNAGGLRIYGGELETTIRPVEGLSISAGGAYTDSKLTEDLQFVSGHQGDTSPYTPKWTFNASVDYTRPVSERLSAFVYANYQYTGERKTRFSSTASNYYLLPAYGVFNARVGINADAWSAELFGENLGDERGEINRTFNPYATTPATYVTVIQPRTVGVKLRVKY